ncbi:CpaF family protein, partial [Blastococcus sp. SYSU DS0541]
MRLGERLDASRGRAASRPQPAGVAGPAPSLLLEPRAEVIADRPVASSPTKPSSPRPPAPVMTPVDALGRLKDRVAKALFERMGARMSDPSLAEEQLRALVLRELDE